MQFRCSPLSSPPAALTALRLFIQNIGFSEGAHFTKVMRLLPDERISMSPGGSPLVGIDLGGARRTRGARRFRGWEGPELEVMLPPLQRHGPALVPCTLRHIRVVEHHAVWVIGSAHRDANGPRLICWEGPEMEVLRPPFERHALALSLIHISEPTRLRRI